MELGFIKTLLLIASALLILHNLFFTGNLSAQKLKFLVSSLTVTLILIFIIVLKLHHYFRAELNIPNTLIYFLVSVIFILHFFYFRYEIIKANFVLLILSIGFIFCAVLLDLLTDGKILVMPGSDLIEELLRIAGTGLWMLYYLHYSFKLRKI